MRKIAAAFVLAAAVSIFAPTAHADKELDANAGVFKVVHVDPSVLVTYDCPSGAAAGKSSTYDGTTDSHAAP
ncbi:hypothetical protein ACIG56_00195 [Nocardia fusca]|uniref:hypothetical protein n=1 Tax=Nocardia fusca TaxID=941183 RepID=UPI0037C55ADC